MAIKITSTSTCDLPQAVLDQYDITLVPLYTSFGDRTCRDGVDVQPEDIFDHVARTGELPTTAAVNLADYQALFAQLAPQYEAVIHITIGQKFSSCYQNACIAAEGYDNVYVVDSANLTAGHGLLVLDAAQSAAQGMSAPDIVARLERLVPLVDTTFVLDKLDYLAKGGRCSSVVALGANLLKLKPCINLVDGAMSVGKKYRGAFAKVVPEYVQDQLAGKDVCLDRAIVVNTRCDEAISNAVIQQLKAFGFREVLHTIAGCTISCHCGPNTLGILFLRNS
jgi:DegV family protein with EDD domain